jgi:hypothetical protein
VRHTCFEVIEKKIARICVLWRWIWVREQEEEEEDMVVVVHLQRKESLQHLVYIKSSVVAICDLTSLDLHSPSSITCRVVFCLQQSSGSGQRVVSFGSIFSCPLPKWQILNPLGVMAHWYGPFCNPRSTKNKKVLGSSNWCRGNSLVFFFFFF